MSDPGVATERRDCPLAVCRALVGPIDELLSREWLLTNGLGGYASGTVIGCPTRRYHGLLVSARCAPLKRAVLLAGVVERLSLDGRTVELANFEFNDTIHPQGYRLLKDFDYHLGGARPFVQFIYQIDDLEVRKRLSLVHGHDVAVLEYDISMGRRRVVGFDLLGLVACRDFHQLRRKTATDPFTVHSDTDCAIWLTDCLAEDLSLAAIPQTRGGAELLRYDRALHWWYNFRYRAEADRGLDFGEDLFAAGWWHGRVRGGGRFCWTFVAGSAGLADARVLSGAAERAGGQESTRVRISRDLVVNELYQAADQFIVRRSMAGGRSSSSIIAGYPWFGDWGRDSCISLEGLLLLTGRYEQARQVLCTLAETQADGLIANCFNEDGSGCSYNSVDASLWFIHAADAYLRATEDRGTWEAVLLPACKRVVGAYLHGTARGIMVDGDGLVVCGDASTQLTWMDVKHDQTVFTPRHGKPVEVAALWYHALSILARQCRENDSALAGQCEQLAERARRSFARVFWNEQAGCLYDCVGPEGADGSIRPNQIFAVSLVDSPLSRSKQRAVLECVERELLTPYGLRSLSPQDPRYVGRCVGNAFERDAAYHQGTVWAWLMGPFVEAYLRADDFSASARDRCRELIRPLCDHLGQAGLGSVSEIFDGDPPHTPRGCIAQAWSVAELIRAYHLVHGRFELLTPTG